MAVIIMCVILYWIVKKIRTVSERKRIEAMRKEAEAAKWRSAMVKEQKRLQAEQIRQEKEQLRLAKEQEKQAAQIAKQEERMKRLEQKLELAERDEEHWSGEVSAIRVDMAGIEAYVQYCKSRGLMCKGKEEDLKKLSAKLHVAETKQIKARQARELCEMQLEVA